jgi:small subunit ribosomal protein S6
MKTYELTLIITPEITSEEAENKSKEIESSIQGKGGSILGKTPTSAKTLSYPIKKHASGFMGVLEFQIEPEELAQLEDSIKKDEKIVRHMVTIKKPARIKEKPARTRKPQVAETEQKPAAEGEPRQEQEPAKEETDEKPQEKNKVELKDIEQRLDELLGE